MKANVVLFVAVVCLVLFVPLCILAILFGAAVWMLRTAFGF